MKKVLTILTLFISTISFAQLENNHWSFGYHAGADFSSGNAIASTSSINNNSGGGHGSNAASVSDANGNLLFYTDGITVWDKNNNVMTGGTGLLGSPNVPYDKQSLIIVPKPLNQTLYYIFYASINSIPVNISGFYYSVVNMDPNQNGGNGFIDSTLKNIPLKNPAGQPIAFNLTTNTGIQLASNCMSSTLHKDKDKIWLAFFGGIVESGNVNEYCYEYLITNTGIGNASDGQSPGTTNDFAVASSNIPTAPQFPSFNYIKFSPNSTRLSYDNEYGVVAYSFDNQTGNVSNVQTIYTPSTNISATGFGLEFSPNNNLLYFSTQDNVVVQSKTSVNSGKPVYRKYMRIWQYNFGISDQPGQIPIIIGEIELPDSTNPHDNTTPIPTTNRSADLQLGMDGVIYVSLEHNSTIIVNHLAGVLMPNNVGATQCQFSNNVMNCAASTYQLGKLPQWVHKAKNIWPKVYNAGKGISNLRKDNNGNIYAMLGQVVDFNINYNHVGFIPPPPYFHNYTVQYTYPGITNWVKTHESQIIVLNNGDIQMSETQNSTTKFYNGVTGNPTTPPPLAVQGEWIIAETSNGAIITIDRHANTPIYVHLAGQVSAVLNVVSPRYYKFNPVTNKLFIEDNTFKVYSYLPLTNSFSLIASVSLPSDPINGGNIHITQIDNQDRAYVVKGQILQEFDYIANTYTAVSIPGFNNTSIYPITSYYAYTEDQCMVSQATESNLYAIDFNTMTKRKIHTTKPDPYYHCYLFDGDNVFLGGSLVTSFTIGTQNIPSLSPYFNLFLTKLDLQNDFTSRPSEILQTISAENKPAFNASLTPNPANTAFKIEIKESENQSKSIYSISIIDKAGNIFLKRKNYLSGTNLDIASLKTGMYFIEIVNKKLEKVIKNLIKL